MKSEVWIEEKFQDYYAHRYKIEKTLFSGQSDFQSVDVVETKGHGKMLLNDGVIMITERDEFVYHDMIAHVPLFLHPDPKKVLIIGGGDGGSAREAARHPNVEKVVQVEIDEMVVNACKQHIPRTAVGFENPKVELRIEDGVKFVANCEEKYDVVMVDSTDPVGPAKPLFGPEFYKNIFNLLSDRGIVVSQGESPFLEVEVQKSLLKILHDIFPMASIYNFNNLSYPGGLWSFTYGSKGIHPIKDYDPEKVKNSELDFQYYNTGVHRAAFALPEFMKKNLKELLR